MRQSLEASAVRPIRLIVRMMRSAVHVSAQLTIDPEALNQSKGFRRKKKPKRTPAATTPTGRRATGKATRSVRNAAAPTQAGGAAVARRGAQFPAFAPLLEEFEIAGWSSHRRILGGNFHDWLMLEGRWLLVAAGVATGPDPIDPIEAALVAQAAWATVRAHAHYVRDAGELLTLAARSLWTVPNSAVEASMAIALFDTHEGRASMATAGDCLAWRIRAARSEQVADRQPRLGESMDFTYTALTMQLSLRERLVFAADNPARRPAKLQAAVAGSFARLGAESHRRMMAADALAVVRDRYEQHAGDAPSPLSIVAVRRR